MDRPFWVKTLVALRMCIVVSSVISLALLLGKVYYKVWDVNGNSHDVCFVGYYYPSPKSNNGIDYSLDQPPYGSHQRRDIGWPPTTTHWPITDYGHYWHSWYPTTDYRRGLYPTTHWPYPTRTHWPYPTAHWPYPTTHWPYPTTHWPYPITHWPYPITQVVRAPEEEPEVCEVALVSYSLSILVALAFLTVDAVSGRSHSSRLDVRRLMLASDIVSSIVATLFVAGSLVYYLYGFIESLQSIHDLTNQEIPGEETAAASLIIVFSVASLLSWGCICVVSVRRFRSHPLLQMQPAEQYIGNQGFELTSVPHQPYIGNSIAFPQYTVSGNIPGSISPNITAAQQNQRVVNV